jgi:hypothetical protein
VGDDQVASGRNRGQQPADDPARIASVRDVLQDGHLQDGHLQDGHQHDGDRAAEVDGGGCVAENPVWFAQVAVQV